MPSNFDGAPRIDSEAEFFDYDHRLDPETKKTPKYRTIMERLDDDGDYKTALRDLKKFNLQRSEALDKTSIRLCEGFEAIVENIRQDMINMRIAQSDTERLLGNGAVAEVYHLQGIYSGHCCVKIVYDNEMYAQGNTLDKERIILEMLNNVEVDDVRSPRPFYSFSNFRMTGLVMEELNAFNFRRVIEGHTTAGIKDELPENFDLSDYFSRLKKYFTHLHSLGIYHGDIALRNLMIDRKTGLPLVIDFGKSRLESELDKTNLSMPDFAKSDMAALDSAYAEAKKWLEEQTV
jgi:tRNA A-37 threonylcarbamoyl transferase component Bud32